MLLDRYIEARDLKPGTEEYYRRVWRLWSNWASGREFTAEAVSAFLREQQAKGLSSYTRKSYRNALVALLHFSGVRDPVRPVRLDPLDPEPWSVDEVLRLLASAAEVFRGADRQWWLTLLEAAYYTGLSLCDLLRVEARMVSMEGVLQIRRSKTAKLACVYCPRRLVDWNQNGPVWVLRYSQEYFRRRFRRVVARAGLVGTFKRLRKTAGNEVEELWPGHGHEYLANTRPVFEQHYKRHDSPLMIRPPELKAG